MIRIFFLLLLTFSARWLSAQENIHVYVFIAEECPICNYMGKPLKAIVDKYGERVSFHAVYPVKNSNYKTAQLFKEQYGLQVFETLLDREQEITRRLGATVTPEVVVTDSNDEVLYRGRINSAYYAPGKMKHSAIKDDLDEVLASLLSGKKVSQPWPSATGCYITRYVAR